MAPGAGPGSAVPAAGAGWPGLPPPGYPVPVPPDENPPAEPAPLSAWQRSLRALGGEGMPAAWTFEGEEYRLEQVFQHRFFAATGLYRGAPGPIVLKLGRRASFFGFPMGWLGRLTARHEVRAYRLAEGLEGVPRLLAPVGESGFAREFVGGHSLERGEAVDDGFFPRLQALLTELHQRGLAFVDFEKPDNVLVTDAGRPALVDFQTAWIGPGAGDGPWRRLWSPLNRALLRRFQAGDRYHLLKHQRRSRPDTLSREELRRARAQTAGLGLHRILLKPYKALRRRWVGRSER